MPSLKTIIGIFLIAAILTVAGYLAVSFFFGAEGGEGQEAAAPPVSETTIVEVSIDNMPIALQPDPNQLAVLASELVPPPVPEPQPEATDPTPVPEVTEPEPEAVAPLPTDTPIPEPAPVDGATTPSTAQYPNKSVEPIILVDYQVIDSDNLFRIAEKNSTRVSLMADYAISSANVVPGQVLRVPVPNPLYCGPYVAYVVGEGETMNSIATATYVTTSALASFNGFATDHLVRFNTVLCIP
jgi:LysM repeat protein